MVFSSAHSAQDPKHMAFHPRTPPRLSRQLPPAPAPAPVARHHASPQARCPAQRARYLPFHWRASFRSFCKHMLVYNANTFVSSISQPASKLFGTVCWGRGGGVHLLMGGEPRPIPAISRLSNRARRHYSDSALPLFHARHTMNQ